MNIHRSSWRVAQSLLLAAALLLSCGDDSGNSGMTTTTVTITAPGIVSPNGALVEARPTLVVANVTVSNGGSPTYSFQVATDADFANIVAQVTGVTQDLSGQTSWRVTVKLGSDPHFWRARASVGGTDGPFSPVAKFTVKDSGGGGGGSGDGGTVGFGGRDVLVDDLTNGMTRATARQGGRLTPKGWQVTSRFDYLRYEVHPIDTGYVEWKMTGLKPENNALDQYMIMGMWDPTEGAYRDNAFRVHVQKLWPPDHNPPFLRLRWLSRSNLYEEGSNYLRWDPNETYQFRLEWEPVGEDSFFAYLLIDGRVQITLEYFPAYRLTRHYIEMGIAARSESIVDAVYSDVHIGEK
jgi:hypothetical protein